MRINSINFITKICGTQTANKPSSTNYQTAPLKADTVSFCGRFDDRFPKHFLKEILSHGVIDPISGQIPIPTDTMKLPAHHALNVLRHRFTDMKPAHQVVFAILDEISKQSPRKNIQELLQAKRPKAEKRLGKIQRDTLDDLAFIASALPKDLKSEFVLLQQNTKDLIFNADKNPRKKFKRKNIISAYDDFALKLQDDKLRVAIMKKIRDLPTSENSLDAFIVKYSDRSPEEIGTTLYYKDFANLDHITPESQGGKIAIWTSYSSNANRGDISWSNLLDDNPQSAKNAQRCIDRYIQIQQKELRKQPETRNLLKEYIYALRNEFYLASEGKLALDISKLGKISDQMREREFLRFAEMGKMKEWTEVQNLD